MLPFWIALQFLSSLPIRLPGMPQPQELGRSLLFYPLVGLLFGLLLWGLNLALAGAPLLLHAFQVFKQRGEPYVDLKVLESNRRARQLYESAGMVFVLRDVVSQD